MKLIKTITALIAISLFGASYANAGSHEYIQALLTCREKN